MGEPVTPVLAKLAEIVEAIITHFEGNFCAQVALLAGGRIVCIIPANALLGSNPRPRLWSTSA